MRAGRRTAHASTRVVIAALTGVLAAMATGVFGSWDFASSVGWVVAAATFLVWTWSAIAGMDGRQTARHATREDPSKPVTELLCSAPVFQSDRALSALASQQPAEPPVSAAGLGVVIVALVSGVHTLVTLRYALLYYTATTVVSSLLGHRRPATAIRLPRFTVG